MKTVVLLLLSATAVIAANDGKESCNNSVFVCLFLRIGILHVVYHFLASITFMLLTQHIVLVVDSLWRTR